MADPGVAVGTGGVPRITIYPPVQAGDGGWAPWSPPQPTPPAGAVAPSQSPQENGGWASWSPQAQPAPAPVSAGEAGVSGAIDAMTFGAAPALVGLQKAGEASGNAPDMTGVPSEAPGLEASGAALQGIASGNQSAVDAYNQARQEALQQQEAAQQQHPYAYLGGELGGAVASLPFTGGGLGAVSTGGRILRGARAGAIGGAAFGAGGAVGRGESLPEVAKGAAGGAAVGGVLGGAGSAALETAGKIGRSAISTIRGGRDVNAEASRRVVNALSSDMQAEGPQFTPAEIRTMNAAGTPRAIVHAGGERTRALARSAANTSPEARQALTNLTDRTFEGQGGRISDLIDSLFAGGAATDTDALRVAARKANAPLYKRAYAMGDRRFPGGIMSPKLEQLLASDAVPAAMQTAASKGRNRAVAEGMGAFNPKVTFENGILKFNRAGGPPSFPDLQLWDYTQRALRDMAQAAKQRGERDEAGALTALHQQLRDELDRLVPEFKTARGTAAFFKGAEDAYEAGQNFVGSNADLAGARKALQKFNPAQRELFARGFATELIDKISQIRDRRNVLNSVFLDTPKSRQAIQLALGSQRADEIEALLRSETVIDRLRQALGNSTTARQLAEMGLAGGAVAGFEGLREHSFNPAHILVAALTIGAARHGAKVVDEQVSRRVGEMLASNDPRVLKKGLQLAASRPVLMNALRRASDVTARELINYLRPSGVTAAGLSIMDHFEPEAPKQGGASDYYYDDQNAQPGQ